MLSKFLVSAMAVGAMAAPAIKVIDVVDVVTATVTAGHIPPQATQAPANGGGFLEGPAQPAPAAPAPTVVSSPAPAPAPASHPAPSGGSGPTSGGVPLIDTINQWRAAYNLNNLEWDDSLASQATTVGQDGGGVNEVHQLIPGLDMGQVITPGQINPVPSNQQGFTPFGVAYVAWLCEVSTDPQLSSAENGGVAVCPLVQDVLHMVYSDTGHHDIIVSPQWTKAGCGFAANPSADQETATYQGLWTCNYST